MKSKKALLNPLPSNKGNTCFKGRVQIVSSRRDFSRRSYDLITAYTLRDVLKKNGLLTGISPNFSSDLELNAKNFSTNWQQMKPNDTLLLYHGVHYDPHLKIAEILARKPALLIAEHTRGFPATEVPIMTVSNGRAAWALVASYLANRPQDQLKLVGVTGTNGKTSTVWFLRQLLQMAGKKVTSIGTLGAFMDQEKVPTTHTTPDPSELYPLLLKAVDLGSEYLVMEVSSHSIAQEKLFPLKFDVSVFTSFSQDHLDLHGSMENYLATKIRLFNELSRESALKLLHKSLAVHGVKGATYYGLGQGIDAIKQDIRATQFKIVGPYDTPTYSTQIIGSYFIENLYAAMITAYHLSGKWPTIEMISRLIPVPGRLQKVSRPGSGPHVFIDYAHTPDAIAATAKELKKLSSAPLRIVFGCGGDRDQKKRPQMYAAAAQYADAIYVTSDNPRSEDPDKIIDDILHEATAEQRKKTSRLVEREKAIALSIEEANRDDIILIAGKGHEDYQIIGQQKFAFDDYKVAEKYLAKK